MNNGAKGGNRPMVHMGRGPGPGGPMGARMNVQKPKNAKKTIGRLLRYIGRNGVLLAGLLCLMLIVTLTDLFGPFFQQKAIDTFTVVDGRLTVDMEKLMFFLIIMLVAYSISAFLSYFQGVLSAKLSQSTVFTMRNDLFRKISKLPIRYTDTHKHGDIMSRMTNDVENVSNAISQSITSLISCVITLVGAFSMMLFYSWQMTLIALITIPLSITVSTTLAKFMRKFFIRQQRLLGQLNGQVEEMVTSYKTVVAYGKEQEAGLKPGRER